MKKIIISGLLTLLTVASSTMDGTRLDIIDIGMIFIVCYALCMVFSFIGKLISKLKKPEVNQHGSEKNKTKEAST